MWLWKLIADPDIARSRMLNNFLELTDAARMVTKCVSSGLNFKLVLHHALLA